MILAIYAIALKIGSTLNLDNSVREKFFFIDAIARQCKTEGVFSLIKRLSSRVTCKLYNLQFS